MAGMMPVLATFLKSPFAQQLNGSTQADGVEGLMGYIKRRHELNHGLWVVEELYERYEWRWTGVP